MKLRLVGLLLFVVAPLGACVSLYGFRTWTAQWGEVPVALCWSASRPIWLLHPRWGEQFASAQRSATERRAWAAQRRPANQKHADPYGLSLVLRDGLAPHDDHPLALVLCSGLSTDALELFLRHPSDSFYNETIEGIVVASPYDPLVRADWLANRWGRPGGRNLNQLRADDQGVISRWTQMPAQHGNGAASANSWSVLVEAGQVLLSNFAEGVWGHDVRFDSTAGVPDMQTWRPIELKPLEATSREAYVTLVEQFVRTGPGDLELPFEQRAAQASQELGLDAKAATFAGTSDQGTSSRIVGWHCSLHLEGLADLADESFAQGQYATAADWIEQAEKLAQTMAESVRSPWIYNYLLRKRKELAGIAQTWGQSEDCPPEVAARMAAVLGRVRPAIPRTLPAPSAFLLPAIYLDNLARAFLSTCVVTWAAAGLGWMCLKFRRIEPSQVTDGDPVHGGSLFVAVLAVVLVVAALGLLESCNYFGEDSANIGYGIAGIVLTVTMLMGAWWLVARELAHDGDPSGRAFRRRMFGLIGCALIVVICRLLAGIGASPGRIGFSFAQFERWAFDPTHERLPPFLRVTFALAFPGLLVTYAVLLAKRMSREPHGPALIHPVAVAVVGLVLGNWFLFGPFGEWVHRGRSPAPRHPTEWTPTAVAADTFGNVLNDHFYWSRGKPPAPGAQFGRGLNPLTATAALRVTNIGFWLVLVCAALWAFESWRRDRTKRLKEPRETRSNEPDPRIGRVWLAGVVRSCFWIGLVSLAFHAWCTLGLGYCVSRVIAQG
jgi:hypothetical protein